MKTNITGKFLMTLTVVAIIGFGAYAFADGRMGYGHMMGPDGWGPGWHHRGEYGSGQEGYYGDFSADETAKLDQQRSEFLKATENIRQKLYEKELALRSELAKEDPDTSKASKLQGEISKLQGELDQQRLDYEIQARKKVPNYNRDYERHGPMMGYGFRGGGNCMW